MDLVQVFIDIFWNTATAFVPLMVPVICLILLFRWIQGFLFDRRV